MHPEFSCYVEMASGVAASGRWDKLNGVIKQLWASRETCEEWRLEVLASLSSRIFREYLSLKKDYESVQDPSLLAWRARNLLELSVWAMFCSKDVVNAHQFYGDRRRDVMGILNAFIKWGKGTGADRAWLEEIEESKGKVFQSGSEHEDSVTLVRNAAAKCGLSEHFALSYKFLSKFTHPTAMCVLDRSGADDIAVQRDVFFSQGCLHFTGAFDALEIALQAFST